MSAKTIHSMIRVRDEAKTLAFYRAAFGLEEADRYTLESATIIYLKDEKSPFEL